MAKDTIRDYSATSSNNSDIQSVDISEGCAPSGLNNAIREVMTDLKNVSTGTVALETPVADSFSTDTISEKTSATGVTIDGVLLKDNTVTATSFAVTGDLTVDTNTLYVDSTNNRVGVGTVSPSGKLNLATGASTACELRLTSNNTGSGAGDRGRIVVYSARNDGTAYEAGKIEIDRSSGTADQAHILFATNNGSGNTERLRIASDGKVYVGTTTNANAGAMIVQQAGNGTGITVNGVNNTSGAVFMYFTEAGGNCGYIQRVGQTSAVTYATSSDYRLKENVQPMTGALTKVSLLNPVTYDWIAGGSSQGFIAHELQEVIPEAVTGVKDQVNEDGSVHSQGVDTSYVVATLTSAIQEQQTAIEALTARITALEAN